MQQHHYIALSFLAALFWAFLVLVRKSPDDKKSGTLIGQSDSGAPVSSPPANHFVSVCMYCHRVLRGEPITVSAGDVLRVSHGICPACERIHFPASELEQWAQHNTMLKVPAFQTH